MLTLFSPFSISFVRIYSTRPATHPPFVSFASLYFRRYFKVALSRHAESPSLETISRRHQVPLFSLPLVSPRLFSVLHRKISPRVPGLAFRLCAFSPPRRVSSFFFGGNLRERDSCRPPISRTRISPLRIFNFNIFLHRSRLYEQLNHNGPSPADGRGSDILYFDTLGYCLL